MISFITGEIIKKHHDYLVILAGGIGYQVVMSEIMYNQSVGEQIDLWTAHITREDSETLYGFATETDLEFFNLITTVSGIGPKLASGIIGAIPTETIISAISSRDSGYLSTLPGIGKKTALRLVMYLLQKEAEDTQYISAAILKMRNEIKFCTSCHNVCFKLFI